MHCCPRPEAKGNSALGHLQDRGGILTIVIFAVFCVGTCDFRQLCNGVKRGFVHRVEPFTWCIFHLSFYLYTDHLTCFYI